MAKPEWGMKHECPNCSVRFYDLQKPSPITCISCGYEFAVDVLHRVRKTKAVVAAAEDEVELNETESEVDTGIDSNDSLLMHDNDGDDDEAIPENSDVININDDMFSDDDAEISEELPEDLLVDDEKDLEDKNKIKSD